MAENVILAEQTLEFADNTNTTASFVLEAGSTYKVLWGEDEYNLEASYLSGVNYIGNASIMGMGEDTEEPFVFVDFTDGNDTMIATTEDTTSKTVAIYQVVADEVGILLKDYTGTQTEYKGIETVTFDTTDGGTQVFSKGQAVEGVEIALDFSGGDQTVNAADGTLVKSAVIKKPDTLVAENIVKDVEIAGVVGKFETVLETLEVTENGTFTPSEGVDGFSSVEVNVEPVLAELSVTENGVYTPEDGTDGFSSVTVDVKSANVCYIGTSTPDSTIGNDGDLYIVKG